MVFVAIYGVFLVVVSLWMIATPDPWVDKATDYVRWRFMHPVEILIAAGSGIGFVLSATSSPFPLALTIFGYLLVAIGIGLVVIGPTAHRRFGVWSFQKVRPIVRPSGFASLIIGIFLVYISF